MQVIQELLFGNQNLLIYNDVEDPLFDCQEVLIHILGYKKSNENWFYKENKINDKYIRVLNQHPGKHIRVVHQDSSKQKKYFTEIGLYRCLFTSQKPIAIEFQEQVAQMLKDIRINNLKLLVQKECETTKILQENKQLLLAEITKSSELQNQVIKLKLQLEKTTSRLTKAQEQISIYEIKVDDKRYRGSTNSLLRRLEQHRSKSSNPELRRRISEGKLVEMTLVHQQVVTNRQERNMIERAFIKQIPVKERLNKSIPRVRDSSLVSEECKQELQEALNGQQSNESPDQDDLTTIAEANEIMEDKDLREKVLKIKEFIARNNQYPLQKGPTLEERSLAMTVQYLRRGRKGTIKSRGKLIGLKDSTIKMVDELIPGFIWANHKSKYEVTNGVQIVQQKKPQQTSSYNRITDDQFKEQLSQFIKENPRKLRDRGSAEVETKYYKKIKNLVEKKTKDQLKEYFGNDLYNSLQRLGIC